MILFFMLPNALNMTLMYKVILPYFYWGLFVYII